MIFSIIVAITFSIVGLILIIDGSIWQGVFYIGMAFLICIVKIFSKNGKKQTKTD